MSRGLFVCLGLIILATFLDYGLTYDEGVGSWYGRLVLKWYASFFKDQSALGYYDLHLYGGFFEATAQAIVSLTRKISPLGFYETRHLINALFGLLGIYYTSKLGTHIAGPRAGFFSGLAKAPGAFARRRNSAMAQIPLVLPRVIFFIKWTIRSMGLLSFT